MSPCPSCHREMVAEQGREKAAWASQPSKQSMKPMPMSLCIGGEHVHPDRLRRLREAKRQGPLFRSSPQRPPPLSSPARIRRSAPQGPRALPSPSPSLRGTQLLSPLHRLGPHRRPRPKGTTRAWGGQLESAVCELPWEAHRTGPARRVERYLGSRGGTPQIVDFWRYGPRMGLAAKKKGKTRGVGPQKPVPLKSE